MKQSTWRCVSLSLFLSLAALVPGAILAEEDQGDPLPVHGITMSVTTEPQKTYAGLLFGGGGSDAEGSGVQPREGGEMAPAEGYSYLIVELDAGPIGRSAVGGENVYLVTPDGSKLRGHEHFITGWTPDEVAKTIFHERRTKKYLYDLPTDQIAGSVFHFLGAEYAVGDHVE